MSLSDLKNKMQNCKDCILCESRNQIVFGEGNEKSRIIICGEAPGIKEDLEGRPFIGKSGQKLDSILSYIGLKRSDVYILNAVLCRPPNNRVPTFSELQTCRWRFLEQIRLLDPEIIIALGKTALTQIFGKPLIGPLNQYFNNKSFLSINLGDKDIKLFVQYHPSYLLRNPIQGYKKSKPYWDFFKKQISSKR